MKRRIKKNIYATLTWCTAFLAGKIAEDNLPALTFKRILEWVVKAWYFILPFLGLALFSAAVVVAALALQQACIKIVAYLRMLWLVICVAVIAYYIIKKYLEAKQLNEANKQLT